MAFAPQNFTHMDDTELEEHFPIGASITVKELSLAPYEALERLRRHEPVSWVPATNAWFVTRRDLAIEVMRDAERFTVDDERFTTAQVLGTSMLSLDGDEHTRHRRAFTAPFRPRYLRQELETRITARAKRLVAATLSRDRPELRTEIAGPLAVETILEVLGMEDVDSTDVLSWYGAFSDAIVSLTIGEQVPADVLDIIGSLYGYVGAAMDGDASLVRQLVDDQVLRREEIPAAVAVVMFGAIETSEAMTANAFLHVLQTPGIWERLRADRSLIAKAVDESLRLEPAAAVIDRYTTRDVELGGVTIPERSLVTISLLGANRDPEVFDNPNHFDIDRPNLAQHVTFIQGPHTCLGLHVARAETHAAIAAALDWEDETGHVLSLNAEESSAPAGLIFRKPLVVSVQAYVGRRRLDDAP
jgi:cytochrome P450